jgi:hypothetical protein
MLDFFGASDGTARTHQACTKEDLEAILTRPEFENPKGVHVSLPIAMTSFLFFSLLRSENGMS